MFFDGTNLMIKRFLTTLFIAVVVLGCDPEGRKQCHWMLEPGTRDVEPGFISLCARNRQTMKQDCRLQATKEQIANYAGKKFRYVDLKVKSPALPRTIVDIQFCKQNEGV